MSLGKLYVVATPIGNLDDITYRAVETLKTVDLILAEDTRNSINLLKHYNIDKKLKAYHQHSSQEFMLNILDLLNQGLNLALISDAGTPGVNDPGNKLIAFLLAKLPELEVVPIPGASALTTLLSVSGHHNVPFTYLGFLPHKKGKETILKMIALKEKSNFIFLDNPHRLLKNLKKLSEFIDSDREIVIGRELTKMYESFYRGTISQVITQIEQDDKFKGEVTVFIAKKHK